MTNCVQVFEKWTNPQQRYVLQTPAGEWPMTYAELEDLLNQIDTLLCDADPGVAIDAAEYMLEER